ncbi:hypothetical protein JS756_35095 [Streptomyces actuosus]|uniref:Phage holin family protein n=1 Tax=Streptomyces actuosus TaxID=1885 RepID=A0ABS2W1B5_STRAS|nr:hypothetical protein [Streptomyces actuosus]MBN0049203.1 hypothetical protein [Streptomyces actuosus]
MRGDGRSPENFEQEVLEAARLLNRYREAAARRNRIAMVLVCVAVGLSAFAVGVLVF